MEEEKDSVLIIGDWDADGVVSTSITVYSQEKLGVFPLKGRRKTRIRPAGPRSINEVDEGKRCWECVVILDIPYTDVVEDFLKDYRSLGCIGKIVYFDHHPSTIENAEKLEKRFAVETFLGKSATSILLYRFLEGKGVRLPEKLRKYAFAVGVLEGRSRIHHKRITVDDKFVKLVASISKTLNTVRDPDLWRSYVKWLASPLPTEPPRVRIRNAILKGTEVSAESDEEIKRMAMNLAISSERLGYIRFVDARGKWRRRGATALASQLYRIVKEPIALIVDKDDNSYLLIIRGSKGLALALAKKLAALGILEDVGGHGNISVSRLRSNFDLNELKNLLRRSVVEVLRELES